MTQTNGTAPDAALVSEKIKEVFRKFLHTSNVRVRHIDIQAGSIRGDNYLGIIARAQVTGSDDQGRPFERSYIIKSAPRCEGLRDLVHIRDAYEREIYVYTHILPAMRKLQAEKSVERPFASMAECLMTSAEDKDEALIMTDMKSLGYCLQNRKKALDYQHVRLVLHELARLHALSFTLRDQQPEVFREFSKLRKNIMSEMQSEGFEQQTQKQCQKAQDTLDPVTDAEDIKAFEEYGKKYFTDIAELLETDCEPYSVIRHGDCWTNNVLFAYEDKTQPKVPTNLCFLDWQLSHVASPVLDILYFVYACTDGNLRDNHFDELLQYYYATMTDFAAEMGSDIHKLYPHEVFMGQLQKFGRYGLCTAIMLLPLLTSESDEIPDMNEIFEDGDLNKAVEAFSFTSKNDEEYSTRMRDVIKDSVKRKFLHQDV